MRSELFGAENYGCCICLARRLAGNCAIDWARRHDGPHRVILLSRSPVVEAASMDTDLNRVIVTTSGSSTGACVHHRDFPEIRAEGGSPEEAASHLVNKLACALDSALTDWRRETVDLAIADVRAFLKQG